jgi:polar amino acid transport system substrate-binding protein
MKLRRLRNQKPKGKRQMAKGRHFLFFRMGKRKISSDLLPFDICLLPFDFCLLLVFLLPSCFAQTAAPDLRWGADSEGGAPFVFSKPDNPRELIGFEVDLINALGRELNRHPAFVQNQWDGLIPGLQRGNYHLAMNGVEITPERQRVINFTIPYYATVEQLAVRAGTTGINSLADLKGKVAGALKFSLAHTLLDKAGGIEVRTYDSQVSCLDDLIFGRLDAALMELPVAVYYVRPNPKLQFAGEPFEPVLYGIGVRKQDQALLAQVNDALRKLMKSGELRGIYEKWNIWNKDTEKLFVELVGASQSTPAASPANSTQAYEEFTKNITSNPTWGERMRRYWSYLPFLLLQGAPMTLLISVLGMIVAMTIGLVLALTNLYGPRPLVWLSRSYIEVVRGTPLLIQLYLIFYGLPSVGIKFTPLVAAVVGLGLNYAAYEAENYRAGIQSIPRGQMEAALSLGMTRAQSLRHVIVPQALRLVIPPVTNDFIALFKDSSIVSVITMVELTKVYGQLATAHYDYIGVGILTAAIYFLLGLPFVKLARYAEKRLATDQRTPVTAKRRWFGVK